MSNEQIYAPANGAKAYDYIHLTDGYNVWILPVTTRAERQHARACLREECYEHTTIWHGVPEWRHSKSGRSYVTRGQLHAWEQEQADELAAAAVDALEGK